jgi:hypothetical protein
MSRFGKVFAVLAAIVVVVALGLAVGLWGSSRSRNSSLSATNENVESTPTPVPSESSSRTQRVITARTNNPTHPTTVAATPITTSGIPDWEEKVDAILTSEIPDNEKAKKMLELFPQLSPEAQEEVAHHLSNLVPDEEYAPLGNYLTNAALPEAVLDVLLEDVFNRPNSVKLPRLLDIASNPQHPKASESKDVLELFLEEDYGTDWSKWRQKMDEWLKANPD